MAEPRMKFFSEQSPLEVAVIKATDENLTRENWEYIIDVCDKLNATSDVSKKKLAIDELRKRLESRNANVQLYSLTLLNAIAQNTGYTVHREIADAPMRQTLVSIGTSSATHRLVKKRTVDILKDIAELFDADAGLAQIRDTYNKVAAANGVGSQPQPRKAVANAPPPPKAAIQDDDEDEQLKLALELSLKESQVNKPLPPNPAADARQPEKPEEPKISRVRALYDFAATEEGELPFKRGDVIEVLESKYQDWWKGTINGRIGIFPLNYVEPVKEQTPVASSQIGQSSQADQGEAYIFAQARNVEKLLTIFASASQHPGYSIVTNDDVQKMYHEAISLRPKLIQMIDEYSGKKQRLMELNDKLVEARQSYERLVTARVAPQAAPVYGQQYQIPTETQPLRTNGTGGYGQPSQPSQPAYGQPDQDHRRQSSAHDIRQSVSGYPQATHPLAANAYQTPQYGGYNYPPPAQAQAQAQPQVQLGQPSHPPQAGQEAQTTPLPYPDHAPSAPPTQSSYASPSAPPPPVPSVPPTAIPSAPSYSY